MIVEIWAITAQVFANQCKQIATVTQIFGGDFVGNKATNYVIFLNEGLLKHTIEYFANDSDVHGA